MSPEASDSKTSESTNENDHAATNGNSRFSEDDMDTEIEVTPEEAENEEKKKKKKKKSEDREETEEERKERKKKRKEKKRAAAEGKPPPYEDAVDEVVVEVDDDDEEEDDEEESKKAKKREIKKNMNRLLDTPALFAAGIFVCVVLPFGIYACDVILSVNVIDIEEYKDVIIAQENDFSLLPNPEKLTGKIYDRSETVFMAMQINTRLVAEAKKRRQYRDISEVEAREAELELSSDPPATDAADEKVTVATSPDTPPSTSPVTTSTTTPATTLSSTASSTELTSSVVPTTKSASPTPEKTIVTTAGTNGIDVNATVVTTTDEPKNTTLKIKSKPPKFRPRPTPRKTTTTVATVPANTTVMDPEPWKQQEGEFCKGIYYFYELHHSYANESDSDWFDDQTYSAYQKEQALFFMFTILGFIFLLVSLALRCDIFLSDEWSSFILLSFVLYSISMAITASVFGQESSNNGLRCATCRFTSNCSDIDPWDYTSHWPRNPDNDNWSLVALLSFIFKLVDCYAIAIVTLKFIIDFSNDLWWVTILKLFGWLIAFPLLIFTPMLGVIRYQVLPGVTSEDDSAYMAVQVLFFIGIAFWALCLAALPFFCRSRMCSGSEEDEMNEEEEMDY